MRPTRQQLDDTDSALCNAWCGTDLQKALENGSITEDAVTGAELLKKYDDLTLELVTLWRGYLDANLETGVQPSVEDFVLATYVINRDQHRS